MMPRSPYFSIITPTYNRASFLEEMAASVGAQTFQDYEHIIVDDGSTDGTEVLIKQLMQTYPKIVYIKQENKGRSTARNVGIEAAKGEFVCFLDSDDVWDNRYLAELVTRTPESDFLATRMVWINGGTGEETPRSIEEFTHEDPKQIIEQQIGMNVCVKRTLFNNQLFNISLSINEDFELWMRIISSTNVNVVAVPESLYLVTTPEIVGEASTELLDGMQQAQEIMRKNTLLKQIPSSYWKQRTKGILLRRIRLYEKDANRTDLTSAILKYLVSYPSEPVNKSLLVTLLYNLPGGEMLKKLVAVTKTQRVE